MSKVLLIYYSRTGYTASIAKQMAHLDNWEIDEIRDLHPRSGPLGFLRSMLDAIFRRFPAIRKVATDPSKYDLVIIGASVWMKRLCSPVQTYLRDHRHQFRKIAFFCTHGGQGADVAIKQCGELTGKTPVATLQITDAEIEQASYWPKLDEFTQQIRRETGT